MGKLSSMAPKVPAVSGGALQTGQQPTGTTCNGAPGYAYNTKTELFLLAVSNFVGEDTFYEDAKGRDTRYVELIRKVAAEDPKWIAEFLRWLRRDAGMRSASIVGAVEAARVISALVPQSNVPVTARQVMISVLARADEPGEALGYWLGVHGRKLPKWLKRALADAAMRFYTPFNVLKWDSPRNPIRMADVVEFSQGPNLPGPHNAVFKYLLDDRHGRGDTSEVPMLQARKEFEQIPVAQRRELLVNPRFGEVLKVAGLTWEAVSGWLRGPMDAAAWEACIPLMRWHALLKNLANFERAGISPAAKEYVIGQLTDRAVIRAARVMPMQILNAYNNVPGDTFKAALDTAATYSMQSHQVPFFTGRTLILIDTSGSMNSPFTTHQGRRRPDAEHLMRWDVAALFGIALSMRCENADIVSFSSGTYNYRYSWSTPHRYRQDNLNGDGQKVFERKAGENLLAAVSRFRKTHFLGGGTDTTGAVANHYKGHDRLIILTDEQADRHDTEVYAPLPQTTPSYTFNLAGYRHGHAATTRNRHLVGGLSDTAFRMIASIESATSGTWPWEQPTPE